jgi:hypothetical protein
VNANPQTILPFASATLSWDEVLANGRSAVDETGELRTTNPAHLPPEPDLPDIYALCPGCDEHSGGGIFPAAELLLSDVCPAGQRLRGSAAGQYFEEKEDPSVEREGSTEAVLRRRSSTRPSSLLNSHADNRLRGGSFPRFEALTPESSPDAGPRFSLTRVQALCSGYVETQKLRITRAWFFRRRAAICRSRLSRIANAASSIS